MQAGTLDGGLAGLLWLAVDRKASLIFASEPPMAGKTTLLTALILLLPPHYEVVYTWGWREDFAWLAETDPARTYIMVNEISDHLPTYLWGPAVRKVFEALGKGYSLGATMHATTPQEVFAQLMGLPIGVSADLVACVHLLGFLEVVYGEEGVKRRLSRLELVLPPGPHGRFPPTVRIGTWDGKGRGFRLHLEGQAGAALANRLGLSPRALSAELEGRSAFLEGLARAGIADIGAVRQRVLAYSASHPRGRAQDFPSP
uniref:TypeII/typeIV secretory system protein, ATPase n=1 Tax=uncultured prokaryote TaxID=198431 RepID=H5SLE7_9ZZZZ|nr:typeII/typeIV secretory system protein, ATPase [uncultured prokaryote]